MESSTRRLKLVTIAFALLVIPFLVGSAGGQGLPTSPYNGPSMVREGLDLAPSNPLNMPTGVGQRGSDSIYLNSGMFSDLLPLIPNLEVGYLYSFGKSLAAGRLTVDYFQPVSLGANSVVFGEAHGEFTDFWKTLPSIWRRVDSSVSLTTTTTTEHNGFNERADLAIGGGYRTLVSKNTLLGINSFFDSTKLGGAWYTSGGIGLEFAALLSGNDAIDLTFNWYGDLFSSNFLVDTFRIWSGDRYRNEDHINTFRRGPSNYDFQAGYCHELWDGGPDLRLNATGYRFGALDPVYGTRLGAELKTRDGLFTVKYEISHDKLNGTYHEVGGLVNLGLGLGNLLNGESPVFIPEPIFRSPRNLRRLLTQKVRRRWHAQASELSSRSGYTRFCIQMDERIDHKFIREDDRYDTTPELVPYDGILQFRIVWSGLINYSSSQYVGDIWRSDGKTTSRYYRDLPLTTESGVTPWTTFSWNLPGSSGKYISFEDINYHPLRFQMDGEMCIEFRY